MDTSLLVPFAIHSIDINTTKKLLCVCKHAFENVDIWKFKLEYEFPDTTYIDYSGSDNKLQNSYKNYYIRKTDNFSILFIDDQIVDINLYEQSSMLENVLTGLHPYAHFMNIKIRNRLVLLEDDDLQGYREIGSFSSQDEVMLFKNEKSRILNNEHGDRYNSLDLMFLTIDFE